MRFILKLKHLQIFTALVIVMIITAIIPFDGLIFGSLSARKMRAFIGIIGVIFYIGWPLFVGLALDNLKENPYRINKLLFILFSIICILQYSELNLLGIDGFDKKIPFIVEALLPILTIFGLFYTYRTVSKSLNSYETGTVAGLNKYIKDAFLFFIMPIGVWFIQPRLNKIDKNQN